MENYLLSEVIEVEKEIQKRLDEEKVKAREWLEQTRREFEEEFAQAEKDLAETLQRSLEEAKKDAELKADETVKQATLTAERLAAIKNDILLGIVSRHLNKLLPG